MPKSSTVVVTGATGKQGGALARLLLDHGHRVRALTRTPKSLAAVGLRALGAEVYDANLEDGSAVRRAAEGADSFFLVATPFEAGVEAESRQGCTAAKAAAEAGVKHLVYSSVACADQNTGIPHFESKRAVEQYIEKLGVPYTVVGPVFFMENLLAPAFMEGFRAGILAMPLRANPQLQAIAIADIAGFVRLLLERPSEFVGRRIDIASDSLTGPEIALALALSGPEMATAMALAGKVLEYVEAPLEAVRARNVDLARMWEWFGRVGTNVDVAAVTRSYPEVGWHDLPHWARQQDWSALNIATPEQLNAS